MKEAAGEANLTVVAIILIAVIVAVATPLINSLMKSSARRSCCTDNGGIWSANGCTSAHNDSTGQYNYDQYSKCVSEAGQTL
jgi:hypothetical protein